jgi:hypothetical protein
MNKPQEATGKMLTFTYIIDLRHMGGFLLPVFEEQATLAQERAQELGIGCYSICHVNRQAVRLAREFFHPGETKAEAMYRIHHAAGFRNF